MNPIRHAWIVFALAACAAPEVQWDKPGAGPTAVQEDTQRCRTQARLSQPPPHRIPAPSPSVTTQIMSREEELARHEARQFQQCMRERGYSAKS